MIPRHLQIAIVLLLVLVFGGGFYILRLRSKAEADARRAADSRPIAPPVAGPAQPVNLFLAYDDDGVIRPVRVEVPLPEEPSLRAREVLRALIGEYLKKPSSHPLGEGADVRDVYLLADAAVVDTTAAFANGHRSGILVEQLTMLSLVETLSTNVPGIARVKVLVDGQERDTLAGHADLGAFYDVQEVHTIVKGLQ